MNGIPDTPELRAIRDTLYENGEHQVANRYVTQLEMRLASLEAKLAARTQQKSPLIFTMEFNKSMADFCRENKCNSSNVTQTQLMDFYTDFIVDYTKLYGTDDKTLENVTDGVRYAGRQTLGKRFEELPTNEDIINSVCSTDAFMANQREDMQRIIYADSVKLADNLFSSMEADGAEIYGRNKRVLKLINDVLDNISYGNDFIRNEPSGKLFDEANSDAPSYLAGMSFRKANELMDDFNSASRGLTNNELDEIYYVMQDTLYRLGGETMPEEIPHSDYRTENQNRIFRATMDPLMHLNDTLLFVLDEYKHAQYNHGNHRLYEQIEKTKDDVGLYIDATQNKEISFLLNQGEYVEAYKEFTSQREQSEKTDKNFMKRAVMILGADVTKLTQVAKAVHDNSNVGENNFGYAMELLKYAKGSQEFREEQKDGHAKQFISAKEDNAR